MSEWQPIETAPKDGTEVLVFDEGGIIHQVQWTEFDGHGWWHYSEEILADVAPDGANPTHWRPLPKRPE